MSAFAQPRQLGLITPSGKRLSAVFPRRCSAATNRRSGNQDVGQSGEPEDENGNDEVNL